ncbi:MAG: glycosyltransferase family 2 protein [Ruminococcaceae bacterium]|nr:glycosyltransferase family 2 protein [Oscillospiraceae bacterium]
MRPNRLFVVVPCYNEEEVLPETSKRLAEKMASLIKSGKIAENSRVAFVNDGSKDKTWEIIQELKKQNPVFTGVNLSRNRGHQNALLGGLMTVMDDADITISMDADLQDDINAIDEMIDKYHAGCDIVYGVRSKRKTDTFFKRFTAESFYRVMDKMGAKTVFNHADYRLMSKRALQGLAEFKEVNLFLRGIVPMVGYPSDVVYYERAERFAGESKYPLKKMISFSIEGITSLSTTPIRAITKLGIFVFLVSIGMLIYSIVRLCLGHTVSGWTSLITSIWAIGGLLMISVGVVGAYVGKIYLEAKGRPRFIIEKYLEEDEKK